MTQKTRTWCLAIILYFSLFAIIGRLFYWQIIKGDSLQAIAQNQYQRSIAFSGERGTISTSDGYTLADNETVYRLFANPQDIEEAYSVDQVVAMLSPILHEYYTFQNTEKKRLISKVTTRQSLVPSQSDVQKNENTSIEHIDVDHKNIQEHLRSQLHKTERTWVSLAARIDNKTKQQIDDLSLRGIGFDPYTIRSYPESDIAAHILGFVGKNEHGEDLGYFGIEGGLDNELKKRQTVTTFDTGLFGFNLFQPRTQPHGIDGRDITLSIRRDVQHLLERELARGLNLYGAIQGEIIVMEPSTGKILGMATSPHYHPGIFYEFDQSLYRNPAVSHVYEPGSTFKPITVAAGIDAGIITPNTQCPRCDRAVRVAGYDIRTWNNQYTPNITITDALTHSDNVAMVYIAQELGVETFKKYIEQFGIGAQTLDEFQEDRNTPFPQRWGPVELATRSFGQGINMTSMQLIRAIGAIANGGVLMQPTILESVYDPITHSKLQVEPRVIRQVISPEAAQAVTQIMINSSEHGEAQWTASKTHTIAAKTGTAQIARDGGYDESKTIASYVGYAPAQSPQYVMLVKLVEPESSHWASETAAPLWHSIATQLHLLLEIPPDKI